MTKIRFGTLAFAALVALSGAIACGSDDDEGGSGGKGGSAATGGKAGSGGTGGSGGSTGGSGGSTGGSGGSTGGSGGSTGGSAGQAGGGGSAGADGGTCLDFAAFVIDLVDNQTLETNDPTTTADKNFCTPITEDPAAFDTLLP